MSDGVSRRGPAKESFWRRRVAQQAESGLSVRDFCRQHDLKEAAFYRWRRELSRRDEVQQAVSFVPVHVTEGAIGTKALSTTGAVGTKALSPKNAVSTEHHAAADRRDNQGAIEIVLTGGRCIRIRGAVDRRMLTDVLAVLEQQLC